MMDRKGFLGFIGAGLAALGVRKELDAEETTTDVLQAKDAILELDGVEVPIEPRERELGFGHETTFAGKPIPNVVSIDVQESMLFPTDRLGLLGGPPPSEVWIELEALGPVPDAVLAALHEGTTEPLVLRFDAGHAFAKNVGVERLDHVRLSDHGPPRWTATFVSLGEVTRADR